MSIFSVNAAKEQELRASMAQFGIVEQDLEESFIRASGPGGQNVNKVSSGVYLKHIPTGTEVKCFGSRSQALNRFHARRIMVSKIEVSILGRKSDERMRIEKIRRQKRKRSKRAKNKMLEGKKKHSEKKALRRKVAD